MRSLSFFVSHVRVSVRSELPEVVDALAHVWACCERPLVETTRDAHFEVRCADAGYAVVDALGDVRHTTRREDALPMLEAALYGAVPSWHARQVLLHAACLRKDAATVLLLGRSGAGKSSLSLCALRAGFEYFSDELAATDGALLWGVARAVQFEPVAIGAAPAPWALDADSTRYRLRLADGRAGVVPLWCPPPTRVPPAPVPVEEAHVAVIAHGESDGIAPLDPLAALAALHEAAYQPPRLDLGKLVRRGRCFELSWSDPERAIDLLAGALAART